MVGAELTVLVTDDESGIRELYEFWLGADFEVETAADGHEAMDRLSAETDVVLLDRDMPGPSGTEVAEHIEQSGHDPHVVMVSSKPMDFDVAGSPVDDYVRKPVDESGLRDAIEACQTRRDYEAALDEYFALTAKLAAIEADRSREELDANERYDRLKRQVRRKRAEVDEALDRSETDWTAAFRTIPQPSDGGCTGQSACR